MGLEAVEARAPIADLAGGRLDEAGDGVEGRGLAGAVGADERENLPAPHLEGDAVDGGQPAEADGEPLHGQLGAGTGAHRAASAVGRSARRRLAAALPPAAQRRHDALGQEVDDQDHQHAVDHPLHLGLDGERPQDLRQQAKDQAADDRPGQRALAAADHHDHHGDGVDEQEHVGVDDAHVVGIERARGAGHGRRDHRRQHQEFRNVDADRGGERLVLPERDHGAAGARGDEPADQHVAEHRHDQHQIVVGGLPQERQLEQARHAEPQRRDVVERHRPLRQLHPVERHQPHHLGKAHRDDDEIGPAHLEGDLADHPAAGARQEDAAQHARATPAWAPAPPANSATDAPRSPATRGSRRRRRCRRRRRGRGSIARCSPAAG